MPSLLSWQKSMSDEREDIWRLKKEKLKYSFAGKFVRGLDVN